MELLIFFTALTVLGVAANLWGAQSSDSRDWQGRCDPSGTRGHHV